MKRFQVILGRASDKDRAAFALGSTPMLVGRVENASIWLDDLKVSRRHLEIWREGDRVLVRNLSPNGFVLNEAPVAADDSVEVKSGDRLLVGESLLTIEMESTGSEEAPRKLNESPAEEDDADKTRAADPEFLKKLLQGHQVRGGGNAGSEGEDDKTRAFIADETPLMEASDLPAWRAPEGEDGPRVSSKLLILVLLVAAGVVGGMFWYKNSTAAGDTPAIEFRSPLYGGYGLRLPPGWTQLSASADTNLFGFGDDRSGVESGKPRLRVISQKRPGNSSLGMTLGVQRLQSEYTEKYKGIRFTGTQPFSLGDIQVMRFAFKVDGYEAEGIFYMDGDVQIVIEAFCLEPKFPVHVSMFRQILMSFQPTSGEIQDVIDYPMPDEQTRSIGRLKSDQAALYVQEETRRGDDLYANRTVRREHLYYSIQAYKRAIQMQIVLDGSTESASIFAIAQKLRQATGQHREEISRLRSEATLSKKRGQMGAAQTKVLELMQVIVDKADPAYQQAVKLGQSIRQQSNP